MSLRAAGAAAGVALAATLAASPPPRVLVGLDVLVRDGPGALTGRRVGLIVHSASVTASGTRAIDELGRRGVTLVRLFAPEHGLESGRAAGERFGDAVDERSGIPVVSLYGQRTGLTAAGLDGLDVVVYDLQDAGVRFYTYATDLILALEAAASSGVELVVLDRPNPLGGERVEGPVSDGIVPPSHVNRTPGPLVHGLTTGELARYVNATLPRPARLRVVPMEGWRRSMSWADTGREWIPPSPNLRTAEASLAYPGVALLEDTNVSEGRGTEAPFLLLGAPWVDAGRLLKLAAPGFSLRPARFSTTSSQAAPTPKYLGQECRGMRVAVTDSRRARPYMLGVSLLHALRRQAGFAWSVRADPLDRLVGTRKLRAALERGDSVQAILAADEADHRRWRRDRQRALLYP